MKALSTIAAIAVGLWCLLNGNQSQAALLASPDGQTVYDTARDVTWLADANLPAAQSFGVSGINPDGSMGWTTAQEWVAAMNAANYLGTNKWALPATRLP